MWGDLSVTLRSLIFKKFFLETKYGLVGEGPVVIQALD